MHLVSYFRALHTFCLRVQGGWSALWINSFLPNNVMSHWQKNALQRLLIKGGCRRILYDLEKCEPI